MTGRRTLALGAVAAVAALLLGASVRPTSASFTAGLTAGGNTFTADTLANYFTAVPGTAVQPGTSTQVAGGNVDALTLTFGTVQAGGPVVDVFRVTNVSAASRTATLALSGPAQTTYRGTVDPNKLLAATGTAHKASVYETAEMTEREGLASELVRGWPVFDTADAKEGARAFAEKRTPHYRRE